MIQGKDSIMIVQVADAPLGADGFVVANQTEGSHSIENEIMDEQTKFGRILGYGMNSESFEFTAYGERGDAGQEAVLDAIRRKTQLKVWEVDKNLNAAGKHDALFAYTVVESVEKSNPTDSWQEISVTVQVIGESQKGELPPLPEDVLAFARYAFETPGEMTGEFPNQEGAPVGG